MALAATTVWEVQTGGDDTNFGGAFDPGQTAGMFTDGAATSATTSAPVFTSASYNFRTGGAGTGDVGAWVYIASGTDWIPGWYVIASVAANAATLTATIGTAVLKGSFIPNTATGCATTGSPTTATWSIDYSQQAGAAFTYADLASAGTGLTVSSATKPFGQQQVGNSLNIDAVGNFNAGRYVIASVAAVTFVATVVGPTNITTGAGLNGTGRQGGCLASPGLAGGLATIAQHSVHIKAGTYTINSTTANIATGKVSVANIANQLWQGYNAVRGDDGTPPLLQVAASGVTSIVVFTHADSTGRTHIRNLKVDGQSKSSIRGFDTNTCVGDRLFTLGTTNIGIQGGMLLRCAATTNSGGVAAINNGTGGMMFGCVAYVNSTPGFNAAAPTNFVHCLSVGNTGASSDGFIIVGNGAGTIVNCAAYGNGRDGFRFAFFSSALCGGYAANCLAESNTGFGYSGAAATRYAPLWNCGAYSNSGGNIDPLVFGPRLGFVTGASSFFTNAAGNDFSLNATASAGAAARAAGVLGVFPALSTTGYLDMGAAQHADPAAVPSFAGFLIS